MEDTENKIQKILFVDDERQILNSLERILMDYDYELFTAEGGEEALEILEEEEDIDLIVSDMRMPYMDGYELLSRVKQKYPRIIRVMLSGYTDEHIIYKALQENIAKLYLLKPWNTSYLLKEIEHIFETEEILNSSQIASVINNSGSLLKIDANYEKVLNLIEKDADIDEVVEAISEDASISANVLRIANSAFFDAKTGSIKDAFLHIGSQSLYTFLKSASVIESINKETPKSNILNKLLEFSFLANKICSFIYERCMQKAMPSNYSSAGLLHNVGLNIVVDNYLDKFIQIIQPEDGNNQIFLEKEETLFSTNHQKIGAYLLDGWDFPYPIVEAALYHHDPLNNHIVNSEIVATVHIAQHYAAKIILDSVKENKLNFNELIYNNLFKFYPEAFDIIEVKQEKFEELFEQYKF